MRRLVSGFSQSLHFLNKANIILGLHKAKNNNHNLKLLKLLILLGLLSYIFGQVML